MKKTLLVFVMLIFVSGLFAQTNILDTLNGDFEKGTIEHWRALEVRGGVVYMFEEGSEALGGAVMTDDSNTGDFAAEVTFAVDAEMNDIVFDQMAPVEGEKDYIYKVWSMSIDGEARLRPHCTVFDADNAIIADYALDATEWVLADYYQQYVWKIPTLPAGAAQINIGFRLMNATEGRWPDSNVTFLIDDVLLYEKPPQINVLDTLNADFEKGTIEFWRALEVRGGAVYMFEEGSEALGGAVITDDSNSGEYAAEVTFAVSEDMNDIVFDQMAPVKEETNYVYKVFSMSIDGAARLRPHCTVFDADAAIIGDYALDATEWILTDYYQEYVWEVPTMPVGAAEVNIGFRLMSATEGRWPETNVTFLIDDVRLETDSIGDPTAVREFDAIDETSNFRCYPNPFNSSTTFSYNLVAKANVKLSIYNINGRLTNVLVNQEQNMGTHSILWNGTSSTGLSLPNGIYLGKLDLGNGNSQNFKISISR